MITLNLVKFISSSIWLLSFSSISSTAPQPEKTLDLGIYKLTIDTENGLAVRRDIDINLPFFKVKRTDEVGFGEPMVSSLDDDDSSASDESGKRRKKRETNETHMRIKREPCKGGGQTQTDGEVARTKSKKGSIKKTKKIGRRRRRRQTEIESFEEEMNLQNGDQNKLNQSLDSFMQKVNSFWKSVVNTTEKIFNEIKQTFNGTKNPTENFEPQKDAEHLYDVENI